MEARGAAADGGIEFAKTTSMSISSTRCRKDRDGELTRRTPAIHFVMVELEDGGVAPIENASDIYFVKLEPEGAEHVGMVPHAAEDGETELARTKPVIFINSVPWRTKAWRLATIPPPYRLGWRRGVRQDDAQRQHPVPRRIVAWSSQG